MVCCDWVLELRWLSDYYLNETINPVTTTLKMNHIWCVGIFFRKKTIEHLIYYENCHKKLQLQLQITKFQWSKLLINSEKILDVLKVLNKMIIKRQDQIYKSAVLATSSSPLLYLLFHLLFISFIIYYLSPLSFIIYLLYLLLFISYYH